jgi:hypothetical protein
VAIIRTIEANPLRARMVTDLTEYRWSSNQAHGFPLFRPFPVWPELGRNEADRRARRRRRFAAPRRES